MKESDDKQIDPSADPKLGDMHSVRQQDVRKKNDYGSNKLKQRSPYGLNVFDKLVDQNHHGVEHRRTEAEKYAQKIVSAAPDTRDQHKTKGGPGAAEYLIFQQ